MKYLFKNFLEDRKTYNLNETYYTNLFKTIIGSKPVPFFNKTFGNGEKIYDDHIFSTLHNERIVQIIQLAPSSGNTQLKARTTHWDDKYDMLVLTFTLTSNIKPVLEKLLKSWFVDMAAPEDIKKLAANIGT